MERKSKLSLLFLFHTIINVVNLATAQPVESHVFKCRKDSGTFPPNSPFQKNLMTILNSLPSNTGPEGYYSTNVGEGKPNEQVFASALCYGNFLGKGCEGCVKNAIPELRKNCPNQKEGVAFLLNCMVRYSGTEYDRRFSGKLDNWVVGDLKSKESVPRIYEFDSVVYKLTVKLSAEAAAGRFKKVSTGSSTYDFGHWTVYGLMQCTPDLDTDSCNQCFLAIMFDLHPCCSGKVAGRIFTPCCYFRYSHTNFLK